MFDEQQRIAIQMAGLNNLSRDQFLSRCTCFDLSEKLDYQLPTPEEVYNNFSKFGSSYIGTERKEYLEENFKNESYDEMEEVF